MWRLITATLAAFIYVLHVFGDDSRRVEVARQAPDDVVTTTLASMETVVGKDLGISDAEAIRIAMAASAQARDSRKSNGLKGVIAAVQSDLEPEKLAEVIEAEAETMWYVTGTRVNLRAGPGTKNAVVGQLVLGSEALVLGDKDGWYQIKTSDGAVSGWIFSSFLGENRPG